MHQYLLPNKLVNNYIELYINSFSILKLTYLIYYSKIISIFLLRTIRSILLPEFLGCSTKFLMFTLFGATSDFCSQALYFMGHFLVFAIGIVKENVKYY